MDSGEMSPKQARYVALAAQGLHLARPTDDIGFRHVARLFDYVGHAQLDSVNVVARSHQLVGYSRFGAYPNDLIDSFASAGHLFEYWGHEASLIPSRQHRLFRWKMSKAADGSAGSDLVELQRTNPWFIDDVYRIVAETGPLQAEDITAEVGPHEPGEWTDGHRALEYLFWCGRITCRRDPHDFSRVYDLTERIIPAEYLNTPTPTEAEARKELLVLASRSLGVATAADLADYHRQLVGAVQPLLDELVEDRKLLPVRVAGWSAPAYLHPDAELPRRIAASTLLSPFDALLWNPDRVQRLFDFDHRVEINVPDARREYGYFVMPLLLGHELLARVDLRADRHRGVLNVAGAYAELGAPIDPVAAHAAERLRELADWLQLEQIEVHERGDLAKPLLRIIRGY